jgi:hypothetical protein
MNLEQEVAELQRQLATVDLFSAPSRPSRSGWMELLVLKLGDLKVKIYQETGHALPHVHVDYGKHNHVASYSIDPIERLAGNLDRKYERAVTEWIASRRPQLLDVWRAAQLGQEPRELIVALAGDA